MILNLRYPLKRLSSPILRFMSDDPCYFPGYIYPVYMLFSYIVISVLVQHPYLVVNLEGYRMFINHITCIYT